MIKNILFDFGNVLLDWDPRYLYNDYFKDPVKSDWFVRNVCNLEWNTEMDAGKPTAQAIAERIALFPEYEEPIRLYHTRWMETLRGEIPGMRDFVFEMNDRGYHTYGITNFAEDKFNLVRHTFPAFDALDGYVVSGEEKLVKPDHRLFQIVFDRFGIKPEETLFIDDNAANIAAGKELGMHCIRFENVEQLRAEIEPLLKEE